MSAWVSVGCDTQSTLVTFSVSNCHLLVERAAQRVQHATLDRPTQRLRVDDQPAVVRAHDPLHPHVARSTVHLDLGDLGDDRLAAEGVGEPAAGEDVARAARLRRRTRVPAILLHRRLDDGDGTRALEPAVVGRARGEQPHAELHRVDLRGRRQFVDERLGSERHLRTIGIAQVARPQRRLPDQRQADDVRRSCADSGSRTCSDGVAAPPRAGVGASHSHELRDQDGVVFVVPEVIVVGRAGVVLERRRGCPGRRARRAS